MNFKIRGYSFHVTVGFDKHDGWIGVYWKKKPFSHITLYEIYICVIPFVPIILSGVKEKAERKIKPENPEICAKEDCDRRAYKDSPYCSRKDCPYT